MTTIDGPSAFMPPAQASRGVSHNHLPAAEEPGERAREIATRLRTAVSGAAYTGSTAVGSIPFTPASLRFSFRLAFATGCSMPLADLVPRSLPFDEFQGRLFRDSHTSWIFVVDEKCDPVLRLQTMRSQVPGTGDPTVVTGIETSVSPEKTHQLVKELVENGTFSRAAVEAIRMGAAWVPTNLPALRNGSVATRRALRA